MKERLRQVQKSYLWWPMFITLAIIVLDQLTKLWTIQASGNYAPALLYEVIPNYFNFVDYRNTGAAWGMFKDNSYLLSFVSLAAFFYFIYDFPAITEGISFRKFSWALLIGGVFGNWVDRFFRQEVIDMVEVFIPLPGQNYRFPAFNVADAAICVGVFLYFVHVIFFTKKAEKANVEKEGSVE